jgi:hypothetical protein
MCVAQAAVAAAARQFSLANDRLALDRNQASANAGSAQPNIITLLVA